MATTLASENGFERAFGIDTSAAQAGAERAWTLFGLLLLFAFLSYVALTAV